MTTNQKITGIPFPSHDVAAFRDGRKTQWRVPMKPQPYFDNGRWLWKRGKYVHGLPREKYHDVMLGIWLVTPLKVGDIVFVKEPFAAYGMPVRIREYKFDGEPKPKFAGDKWLPARSMTQLDARIFLRVKSVRVERLCDITEPDMKAEGDSKIQHLLLSAFIEQDREEDEFRDPETFAHMARKRYSELWNTRHPKTPWNQNPYVFAYEAERCGKEEI